MRWKTYSHYSSSPITSLMISGTPIMYTKYPPQSVRPSGASGQWLAQRFIWKWGNSMTTHLSMYSPSPCIIPFTYHCSLRTYLALVCPYLINGNQTLFTCLCKKIAFLSTLSYTEPGLPRFRWNRKMTVLSIDVFVLLLNKFRTSIESSLLDMKETRHAKRAWDWDPMQDILHWHRYAFLLLLQYIPIMTLPTDKCA